MKISIVIPTYNRCDDLLAPCIESILANSDMSQTQIIVVANGCTDNTMQYLLDMNSKHPDSIVYRWYTDAIGFTAASNAGIAVADGDLVLLLNNDCEVLPSARHEWLKRLSDPFNDPLVMATGIDEKRSDEINGTFLVGYCLMVRKWFFVHHGVLDYGFGPGYGEDIDLCARIRSCGYKTVNVASNADLKSGEKYTVGNFPLYHKGSSTFHETLDRLESYTKIVQRNQTTLSQRYSGKQKVTATVSTRGRYFTTLPLCLHCIATQTTPPDHLIIFDDNEPSKRIDLRTVPEYQSIFSMLDKKGVTWEVVFGEGNGQVKNHQRALVISPHDLIWRLDDDNAPESNVLETLARYMTPNVGAIGGLVLDPKSDISPKSNASNAIRDIFSKPNEQWSKPASDYVVKHVDHLYSTFLFRVKASPYGYCSKLSRVGHREETIFTYEMKKNGYDVLMTPKCVTWHYHNPSGGIRDNTRAQMWHDDEDVFKQKMKEWDNENSTNTVIVLQNGLGDHFAFKSVLPEIMKKHRCLTLAVCYPEVFEGDDVKIISIADAQMMFGDLSRWDVYGFMASRRWDQHISQAYLKMYA